jgi:transaldolase
MEIFVDSADMEEIKKAKEYGICSGVTTNPSLIKKAVARMKGEGKDVSMENYINMICKTIGRNGSVSLEVISLDAKGMVKEAENLYDKFNPVAKNVAIKIPVSTSRHEKEEHYEGLKAISMLKKKGIPVNATLVMTPEQALLAAKSGAEYVSPFAGRIDDWIRKEKLKMKFEKDDYFPADGIKKKGKVVDDEGVVSGVDLVRKILEVFRKYGIRTNVIAASLRNYRQVREVAELGVHIATVPFGVIEEMIKHPKTFEGIVKFSEDVVPEYRKLFG